MPCLLSFGVFLLCVQQRTLLLHAPALNEAFEGSVHPDTSKAARSSQCVVLTCHSISCSRDLPAQAWLLLNNASSTHGMRSECKAPVTISYARPLQLWWVCGRVLLSCK